MGMYINNDSKGNALPFDKAEGLINDGAIPIQPPSSYSDDLVCVVDNGIFTAAGYCFSPNEMQVFLKPDGRSKVWLRYAHAKDVAK